MPGLLPNRNDNQFCNVTTSYSVSSSNGSVSANGFWSKHRGEISYNQLQKFWSELSPQSRQKLLRIDKQTLFEQARKNMYCSRCNGLLLEGFLQIVMYGKSLQQEGAFVHIPCNRQGGSKNQNDGDLCMTTGCEDDVQDPSVHPWGGLTTTRDGTLTLLDCYLHTKSLKGLQNVFDSARARERERELLYPDACGGGGRGWISQGMAGYGRVHGTRETCALHTARLSVDTLVDFWSALGEETRQSLLRMKEDDFIERLMYRFDSKRFCRDCRRNVIREFKELKELKRIRREPRCTSWFCVADTGFQYEVSQDTVQADWNQAFVDAFGTYHHFEWAVGTGEGKSDILEFENVGLSERVQVNGLDLSGLNACYITLRAWKIDGRCTELTVKAHALKGQQCVHCRLVVGDGFVSITRGENIRRFFEHAEEAEEEEDDDSMDKDGNELDGECSRPQKHAKSPELAREFLLDAATVIFKEQVEKAFREGTARQNAHSIFVSLALKLLEERVHVACKEIITLEKQMKLLEEEEKEKREEEERKERRRTKEREKKLRRKERLREKEKDREKKCSQPSKDLVLPDVQKEESRPSVDEDPDLLGDSDLAINTGEEAISSRPASPEFQDDPFLNDYGSSNTPNHSDDHLKYSRRKLKFRKEFQSNLTFKASDRQRFLANGGIVSKSDQRYHSDFFEACSRSFNESNKQLRSNASKPNIRTGGAKFSERLHCSNNRVSEKYDLNGCSCYQHYDYRPKVEPNGSASRVIWEAKSVSKPDHLREGFGRTKSKIFARNIPSTRDSPHPKKVWEPLESQKFPRSNSDSDVTLRPTFEIEATEPDKIPDSSRPVSFNEVSGNSVEITHDDNDDNDDDDDDDHLKESRNPTSPITPSPLNGTSDPSMSSNSNSDSCSSCLSEGDSNTLSSNPQNPESSSTSDSEDAGQTSPCHQNGFSECQEVGMEKEKKQSTDGPNITINLSTKSAQNFDDGKLNVSNSMGSQPQAMLPPLPNQSIHYPMFQAPSVGYYHQSPVSWPAGPTSGLMPMPHPNHYVFANPFGYGLNGNSRFMQYGNLQHLAPPVLNPSQVPVYPPVAQTNGVSTNEHPKISNLDGVKEAHREANTQRVVPMGHSAPEARKNAEAGQDKKPDSSHVDNTGFSLFHFGGPVALSNGYKSNPLPVKEGIGGDLSSHLSAKHTEGDNACNKDAIEEYNLFAASNGIQFSFF